MDTLNLPPNHPLYHPLRLRIMTPAVAHLQETLTKWLWTGATGGFIEGPPRSGKTTGLLMLSRRLRMRHGKSIPCHLFSVPPRDRPTIRSLYRNLCISADLGLNKSKNMNSDIYLESFYQFMIDKAIRSQSEQIILFVDETQRLAIDQLEALAELHDLMAKKKYLLSVFFTGNDTECDKLLSLIESRSRRHIYGRFFTRRATFAGIKSKNELELCLRQYDIECFPLNGPTYTAACLPNDFKNGFRIEQLAPEIWESYSEYKHQFHLDSWGMKYFTSTICTLLLDYLPTIGIDNFSSEVVDRCIEVSGLIPESVSQM